MIIASMCTIPERRDDFLNVLDAVLNRQTRPVDRLHVWLNGYQELPSWLPQDVRLEYHLEPANPGPWKRYEPCGMMGSHDLFLTLDDDVAYPDDYVACGVDALQRNPGNVICFSAINWDPFVKEFQYGSNRWQFMLEKPLFTEKRVSLYKGQTGFLPGNLGLKGIINFALPGFSSNDDMMAGYYLFTNKTPILCCPKSANWLQEAPTSRKGSALFITDSSVRKETFKRLCTELGFDPTAGLMQKLHSHEHRIIVWSLCSPTSEAFKNSEPSLEKLCRDENTTVHVLAKVSAMDVDLVQQMNDKPYFIHPVTEADEGGRLNWLLPIKLLRKKRIKLDFHKDWNERFRLISEKLKPTAFFRLQSDGLKRLE